MYAAHSAADALEESRRCEQQIGYCPICCHGHLMDFIQRPALPEAGAPKLPQHSCSSVTHLPMPSCNACRSQEQGQEAMAPVCSIA
eukprot:1145262-Pelagomonas_calceolata.AAC.2